MQSVRHIEPVHKDERGEIHELLRGACFHVKMITASKGSIRGNHFREGAYEYHYLVCGSYESYACDPQKGGDPQVLSVKPGDLVETLPGMAHAAQFSEDSVLLVFLTSEGAEEPLENDSAKAFQVLET